MFVERGVRFEKENAGNAARSAIYAEAGRDGNRRTLVVSCYVTSTAIERLNHGNSQVLCYCGQSWTDPSLSC